MQFTNTQLWEISSLALHSKAYRLRYEKILKKLIGSKRKKILDSAAGTGFPSFDLIAKGYNVSCSDGDEESIQLLNRHFKKKGKNVSVTKTSWQEIAQKIHSKFDVLLNIDNSLAYMDSWNRKKLRVPKKEMLARFKTVAENFHSLLKDDGTAIIAIARNNLLKNKKMILDIGRVKYHGKSAQVTWHLWFDWKKRIKKSKTEITINGHKFNRTFESYLITKKELANEVKRAGFKQIRILEPKGIYDTLIIAKK
jgi:SAM-dependent methyltransferase